MDLCQELNKILLWLSLIKTKIINLVWILVVYTAFAVVIFLSVIALILTWDQILIIRQIPIERSLAFSILNFIGSNVTSLSPTQYNAVLSSASGVIVLLVTLWFAAFSTYSLGKYRRDLKRRAIVQAEPVYRDGVDDLKIMLKYYRLAGYVAVFAGNFDWLTKNPELKDQIIRLANEEKIHLFSYKNRETVKDGINNEGIFKLLESKRLIHFDNTKRIKCSMIEMQGNRVFLYKSEQKIFGGENYVCIVQGINEGRYLLQMITNLLELKPDT